jgi:hypothetical protein
LNVAVLYSCSRLALEVLGSILIRKSTLLLIPPPATINTDTAEYSESLNLLFRPTNAQYINRNVYFVKYTLLKLLKTNATIWYNKICKAKRLTLKYRYIHIK